MSLVCNLKVHTHSYYKNEDITVFLLPAVIFTERKKTQTRKAKVHVTSTPPKARLQATRGVYLAPAESFAATLTDQRRKTSSPMKPKRTGPGSAAVQRRHIYRDQVAAPASWGTTPQKWGQDGSRHFGMTLFFFPSFVFTTSLAARISRVSCLGNSTGPSTSTQRWNTSEGESARMLDSVTRRQLASTSCRKITHRHCPGPRAGPT